MRYVMAVALLALVGCGDDASVDVEPWNGDGMHPDAVDMTSCAGVQIPGLWECKQDGCRVCQCNADGLPVVAEYNDTCGGSDSTDTALIWYDGGRVAGYRIEETTEGSDLVGVYVCSFDPPMALDASPDWSGCDDWVEQR